MVKCPFCQFVNEDGAIFCEQCKSDLGNPAKEVGALPLESIPIAAFLEESEAVPSLPLEPPDCEEAPRLAATANPRLVVLRGLKMNAEYPLYEGLNFIGRADEKPVDIDLEDQEPADRVWSSRQHAVIALENGQLTIEDLNSSNGTFLNRNRIHPGQKKPLNVNDIIQIGTVQMKVKL
jgi:hypothetical protein